MYKTAKLRGPILAVKCSANANYGVTCFNLIVPTLGGFHHGFTLCDIE